MYGYFFFSRVSFLLTSSPEAFVEERKSLVVGGAIAELCNKKNGLINGYYYEGGWNSALKVFFGRVLYVANPNPAETVTGASDSDRA